MWVLDSEGDTFQGKPTVHRSVVFALLLIQYRQAAVAPTWEEVPLWQNTASRWYAWTRSKFMHYLMNVAEAGGGFVIVDKTISRQHLTVEVEAIPIQECVGNSTSPWQMSC